MCSITLLMQHAAENDLFEMHILSPLVLKKKAASLHLLFHMSVCVSSLSVKSPFFFSPCHTNTHNGRNFNISPSSSHISFPSAPCLCSVFLRVVLI